MPALLVLLKILGVVLLLLVLALLAALFVPMRLHFEYRPGHVSLSASYGPLRRTLFSRGGKRRAKTRRPPEPERPAPPEPMRSAPAAQPAGEAATAAAPAGRGETAGQPPSAPEAPARLAAEIPPEGPPGEPEEEPGRLEHIMGLAQEQPLVLLRCLAGHFRWMRNHAVCKLRIRHLDVFWTVTCEDAADTAMAFGAEMAALNALLAMLQQSISVQSDRLWLEPDFTGARREERRVAFSLSACAILMFGLAYRLWKDPLLRPQPETAQA